MTKNITTREARQFFLDNSDLIPEGDKSVGPGVDGRGRLSKAAKAVLTDKGYTFVEAKAAKAEALVTLNYKHVQPSGRKVNKSAQVTNSEIRALAREAGLTVPERGKMSAAVLTAAGEAFAKRPAAPRGASAKAPVAEVVETPASAEVTE